jgi:hypothetical protein
MTIQAKVAAALKRMDRLCDDCLSEVTGVTPRQSINIACRAMTSAKALTRVTEDCARCSRAKIINRLGTGETATSKAKVSAPAALGTTTGDRPGTGRVTFKGKSFSS